jgi:phosphonate transport system substrate-binding protein
VAAADRFKWAKAKGGIAVNSVGAVAVSVRRGSWGWGLGRVVALLVAIVMGSPAVGAGDGAMLPAYRLGIFPYMAPRQTIQFFGPIAADMEQALGRSVKLESQRSFSDFGHAMAAETYDIALIQPFDVAEFVENRGYLPLARLSIPLVCQFYVRSDSPYQSIADLRGTTIAMPPAESANARMTLRALYDNGLVPGRDVEVRYFNSHDSCVQQVWAKSASACGTARPVIVMFEQRMHASLRSIYDTPPLPHMLFVVHPRVPAADREKLLARVTGWSETEKGRVLVKGIGVPGFVPATAAEYAPLRDFLPAQPAVDATANADQELVLGVFPFLASRQLMEKFAPVLPTLAAPAQRPVRLQTASSFGVFMDGVGSGVYDVVLIQPFDYTKAVASGYLPLARMRDDLEGAFFVRDDSPYRSVADLKGALVSMPPADSANARLGRDMLLRAGLSPGADVNIVYRLNHESCLRDVQVGTSIACITSPLALGMVATDLAKSLRPVGASEKIPGALFLVHKRVPAATQERLRAEIIGWKDSEAGRALLRSVGLGEFGLVDSEPYRKLANEGTRP